MKPKKRRRFPNTDPAPPPASRVTTRALVLLDQAPLRRAAASECQKEMARIDKAKAEWKRFETEDKAAFSRWVAATLGPLMTRMREVDAALQEKEAIMEAVELEMYFGGARSPRTAYHRVMQQRNAPAPEPDSPDFEAGSSSPGDDHEDAAEPMGQDEGDLGFDDLPEEEQFILFDEFLENMLGINPHRMSKREYRAMFEEFRATMRAATGRSSAPPPKGKEQKQKAHQGARPSPNHAPSPPKPEAARVKELYRLLVRRLHPDTLAEKDTAVSALWHDVQEAYAQGNIERLEMLLALTDMQANELGEQTSLAQMRAVLRELRKSFNALQRNISAARKEPAWNFTRLDAARRSKLQSRLERDLESELKYKQSELKEMEGFIREWEKTPPPRPPKNKNKNKNQAPKAAPQAKKPPQPAPSPKSKNRATAFQTDLPF